MGYDSSNVSTSLKVPSSNGVSAGRRVCRMSRNSRRKGHDAPGPKITAFHNMMLSGHGLPEIPPGGSEESRLKSRMSRRLQGLDYMKRSINAKFNIDLNIP